MIKIHIFHTGRVRVDQAIPHKEKNPLAVTGFLRSQEKKLVLPVSCYLIEHPKGRILIDTGWNSKYAIEKPNAFLNSISMPIISVGESVDCKMKRMGVTPADIDCVFLSHMDFDHTSGLQLVRDAKRFMASKEELEDSRKYFFRYVKSDWRGIELHPFSYQETGIGPVGRSYDVFGDKSVLLISTPGHTHGLFSVKISNGEKYVILAGDSIYTQRSIREKIIPGFTVNTKLAKRSLEWICNCVADENCVLVAANHDPTINEQTIEL